MTDPCDSVIRSLEIHPSRLNKEAIIQVQVEQGNEEFFEGCRLALDSMITFGIKQVPEHKGNNGPGLDWYTFKSSVQNLVDRKITGHAARDLIIELMTQSKVAQWNDWYRRILIKDLRCGVSEKTVNKVKKGTVPVFNCQLAHDSANHDEKVNGKKLIEVKLDGVRVITIVYPSGRVDQFSRNGKELLNFGHVKDQLSQIAQGFTEPMVLDGEVMSSSFQDLMKQVHRKDNVKAKDAILYLFDALPLKDFTQGKSKVNQLQRSHWIKNWFDSNADSLPNIRILSQELVDLDTAEGQNRFRTINQQAVEGGYEGIMIKDPEAHYECKRTVSWLKLKPFIEVSLEVVGVEEGTGRNVGRLGALVCQGTDDNKKIIVNVGSGFSDNDRIDFWNSHVNDNLLVGQVVEVRADAITMNQDGNYSLRFPRFLRFRGFVAGEKI